MEEPCIHKNQYSRYLIESEQDALWGLTVSTVGKQRIEPGEPYPPGEHPMRYLFSARRGRVLGEYQLLYLTQGKGTFASVQVNDGSQWAATFDPTTGGVLISAVPEPAFIGLLFGSNTLLKTRLRDLAGSPKGFRIRYAAEAGVIYLIFSSILTLIHISHVSVNDASLQDRIIFILPVLLLTPLQTVSEEIFFRALPARIVYRDKLPETALKALPYAVICGFLFLLPHLWNPEIQNSQQMLLPMLYYFLWGAMAAFLSVATGGFEASIAMHTANNLYIALVANYPGSAMPTEALLIDSAADSAGSAAIAAVVVFIIIYSYSLWRGYVLEGFRWQGRKERS